MAIDFGDILQKAKEISKDKVYKKQEKDDRFITVTKDESGNGSIVVRFIPDKNTLPAIKKYSHFGGTIGDDGKKRYFVAECPTTKDEPCPFCEKYLDAWKYKDEVTQERLKPAKRKEEYIANVYVVKDPGNPENEGKIMLFRYTYKIAKMIETAITGDDEVGIPPINIYDPFEGANLLLKHTKQGEYFSLDGSQFLPSSAIVDSEEEFMELWDQTYDLQEYLDSLEYLPYSELERKLYYFENGVWPDAGEKESKNEQKSLPKQEKEVSKPKPEPKQKEEPTPPASAKQAPIVETEDEDFFASL